GRAHAPPRRRERAPPRREGDHGGAGAAGRPRRRGRRDPALPERLQGDRPGGGRPADHSGRRDGELKPMPLPTPEPPDAPVVCRRLRSKGTPGVIYDDRVSFAAGYVPTATFWCTATADAVGPDDSYVHPHACVAGRPCFEAPFRKGAVMKIGIIGAGNIGGALT